MRSIEGSLTEELERHVGGRSVDKSRPFKVKSYRELMGHIAKLSFLNKDHLLFYRGQSGDYLNKAGASTFYPTIYRDDYLPSREVRYRFELLSQASKKLVDAFKSEQINGWKETARKRYIQWSILQHYEVCKTPLLDFTHSVRVAASFAQLKNSNSSAFVFVFGLPYFTNRISVNSEHDLVNIRLLSICPPDALRPYYQDGYLLGTDDITTEYESKTELDFKNRLIAKFEIPVTKRFWGNGFSSIPESVLYPGRDRIRSLCNELKIDLDRELLPGEMGEFLQEWVQLEEILQDLAGEFAQRRLSVREAMNVLAKYGILGKDLYYQLDSIRKFRNRLVHSSTRLAPGEVQQFHDQLLEVLREMKNAK